MILLYIKHLIKSKKIKEKKNLKGLINIQIKYIKMIKFIFIAFFFIAYNSYRFLIMKEKRNKNKFFYKHEIGENCILKSLLKNAKFENQFRVNIYIYFKLVNIILIRFIN